MFSLVYFFSFPERLSELINMRLVETLMRVSKVKIQNAHSQNSVESFPIRTAKSLNR